MYHPIANGLVERFHRHLKGSLRCLPDNTHWTKALPLILLGIRTAIKQDCRCTAAELVYGTTLCLPGEFFHTTSHPSQLDPDSYATHLKRFMQSVQPPSVRKHPHRNIHVSADLSSCPFVFVRNDAVKKTLQPPYDGPYKVLHRTDKHYTLDISGQKKVVSLDRLKPAYMDETPTTSSNISSTAHASPAHPQPQTITPSPSPTTTATATAATPRTTRSGHHVHWPKRFKHYTSFT